MDVLGLKTATYVQTHYVKVVIVLMGLVWHVLVMLRLLGAYVNVMMAIIKTIIIIVILVMEFVKLAMEAWLAIV